MSGSGTTEGWTKRKKALVGLPWRLLSLIRGSLSEFQSYRKRVAFCPEDGAVDLRFEPQDGGKAM